MIVMNVPSPVDHIIGGAVDLPAELGEWVPHLPGVASAGGVSCCLSPVTKSHPHFDHVKLISLFHCR